MVWVEGMSVLGEVGWEGCVSVGSLCKVSNNAFVVEFDKKKHRLTLLTSTKFLI